VNLLWLIFLAIQVDAAEPETWRSHIVLVGDSTVTDKAGWGTGFAACLADNVKCTNLARGGRSSSSFRDEGHWQKVLEHRPDIVLIQFGHNDEPGHPGKSNPARGGYSENILRYVKEAREAGILPVLVTPISRRQWGKNDADKNRIDSSLEVYSSEVKKIADEWKVPLIDLHDRSKEVYESLGPKGCEMITTRKENGQWDGTHMNRAGANMFGSMVAMDCRSDVPEMRSFFLTSKLAELQKSQPAPSMSEVSSKPLWEWDGQLSSQGERKITVSADGSGDFRTLQEAIEAAPAGNSDRTMIRVKNGVYVGQIIIPRSKPNIVLIGEGRHQTIISYALSVHDPVPPEVPREFAGYGVVVLADGFCATNLTFRQNSGDHGQAIALRIDGDRAVLSQCHLVGWQDTVRLEKGRHYLRDCYIEGRVDYIYGGATAYFENCGMHTKNDGYITAASTSREQHWGYVFNNCRLSGTDRNLVYLGRPWRPYASVTFLNCEMDRSIRPVGWDNWRNPENESTARYSEFNSRGAGASSDARAAWSRQLSQAEASEINAHSVLSGSDHWDATKVCDELDKRVE
jgi:pectinesterase